QEVFPFGFGYAQNSWIQFDIFLDFDSTESSASIYMNGMRMGAHHLPPIDPVEVEGMVITLGDGAYYVGQFDDFLLQEYDLDEGFPDHPASTELYVRPSHGQWFDPSSINAYYSVNVTPCLPSNPYLVVEGLVFELWNSTSLLGEFGHAGWNGTDHSSSPCGVFRQEYIVRIPVHLFDGPGEYRVTSRPSDPDLVNLVQSRGFFIDHSIDAYFSVVEAGPPVKPPVFDLANTYNITIGIEFDPSPNNGGNDNFTDKNCRISWWDLEGELIKNQTVSMVRKLSYPNSNAWVFGYLHLRRSFDSGIYGASISAICNSGYAIRDSFNFTIIGIGEATLLQVIVLLIPAFSMLSRRASGRR
ncbi:MAG: hypothetical protein HXS50_00825, partial [Theionarchaea archaeon]|nr:hypothetical protein [Theionarchaea archaeon]